MGTQVVRAEKLSTSRKGTNVQMDKQGSERHVLLQKENKKTKKLKKTKKAKNKTRKTIQKKIKLKTT